MDELTLVDPLVPVEVAPLQNAVVKPPRLFATSAQNLFPLVLLFVEMMKKPETEPSLFTA
jgi:hypothetical protein